MALRIPKGTINCFTMTTQAAIYLLFTLTLTAATAFLVVPEPRDDLCLVTGPQCSTNCEEIILCPTQLGTPMVVVTCDEKMYCESNPEGMPACSANSCQNAIFRCTTPGAVPDPRNTQAYFLCPGVNTKGVPYPCPVGTNFNTTTLRCSEDTKPFATIVCGGAGEYGPIGEDNKFCYMCDDQNIPLVYLCSLSDHSLYYPFIIPKY